MIETTFLRNILEAFPNGYVSQPILGSSYIYDKNQKIIGYFDYGFTKFYLNIDYKYSKEAQHVLKKENIDFEQRQMEEQKVADVLYG